MEYGQGFLITLAALTAIAFAVEISPRIDWNHRYLKFFCLLGFHNKRLRTREFFYSRRPYVPGPVFRTFRKCRRCKKDYHYP